MKFLFCFLLLFAHLFGDISVNGKPSGALIEVLEMNGVCKHDSWSEIISETQNKWLREKNQELWQITPKPDPHPEKTYALFTDLGMTQTRFPQKKQYDYALILGATEMPMQRRLNFLAKEWNKGVRFKQIVWLVGDRPSDASVEKGGKNETEIAKTIYARTDLPSELRAVPVVFIDTPRKEEQMRPTTIDTINAWLETHPEPGSTLFIADAPFMNRQGSIARKALPPEFSVEIAGEGFSLDYYKKEKRGIAILLDELARLLYLDYRDLDRKN